MAGSFVQDLPLLKPFIAIGVDPPRRDISTGVANGTKVRIKPHFNALIACGVRIADQLTAGLRSDEAFTLRQFDRFLLLFKRGGAAHDPALLACVKRCREMFLSGHRKAIRSDIVQIVRKLCAARDMWEAHNAVIRPQPRRPIDERFSTEWQLPQKGASRAS